MKNKKIIIDRTKWVEAGISRGYIYATRDGNLELRKHAFEPVTLSLLGIGAAFYVAGEGMGVAWNNLTGGRSLREVLGGMGVTTESVAQYETGLIALKSEVAPLLKSATKNVQEALQDAIDQGYTTLELMEQELLLKGMAVPNIDVKQKQEAVARKRREDSNYAILFAAAQKPVGGTRPGKPQTQKADIAPDDASAKSGEAGRQLAQQVEHVEKTGELPPQQPEVTATPATAKASQPAGGKQLNPRILGGV